MKSVPPCSAFLRQRGLLSRSARAGPARCAASSAAASLAAPELASDGDICSYKRLILELRQQSAAAAAKDARRTELQAGRRLLASTLLPAGSDDMNFTITDLFTRFAGGASALTIREPYLVSSWQHANFRCLLEALLSQTFVRQVQLCTHCRSKPALGFFDDLRKEFAELGLSLEVVFLDELHLRELVYNSGVTISSDRSLDIFKAPSEDGLRRCREGKILYFEIDQGCAGVSLAQGDSRKVLPVGDGQRVFQKFAQSLPEVFSIVSFLCSREALVSLQSVALAPFLMFISVFMVDLICRWVRWWPYR